jgi:hypothetical protein
MRDTFCGKTIEVVEPSEVDWLAPTCAICWAEAKARRDAGMRRGAR